MHKTLTINYAKRQAITTKRTESGIAVKSSGGHMMRIARDYSIPMGEERHKDALEKFVNKLAWHGDWVGSFLNENTMVWVNTESRNCKCIECVGSK